MNKKIIQCFLFSLILFGCFFLVNSCNAGNFETQYFTNYEDIKEFFFKDGFDYSNLKKVVYNNSWEETLDLDYDLDYDFWNSAFNTVCGSDSNRKLNNNDNGWAVDNVALKVQTVQ